MFCRNCSKQVDPGAVICVGCGLSPTIGVRYCQNCQAETDPAAEVCKACGHRLARGAADGAKSKIAAALLGIFLGGLGIHRFYLGYTNIGIIQLVLTLAGLLTCGLTSIAAWVWGIVDGIMILTGSIKTDAQGNLLKD